MKILFIIFVLFFGQILCAQKYQFDIQHISIEDGLPNRKINRIRQAPDGFIWLSSTGTLSRFDGRKFKTYDLESGE